MLRTIHFNVEYKPKERRVLNAVLAIITGVLTLLYPNFLYLIAGGYLLALGLLFIYFKAPPILSAFPVFAAIVIFMFPELIPVTFAVFLGFFGLILLFGFAFTVMGILTLLIAALIIANPDSVAYMIAAFLILYGLSNAIRLFQQKDIKPDQDQVWIE